MASVSTWRRDARGKPISWRVYHRTADGQKHSKVFDRKRDADAYRSKLEDDENTGNAVDLKARRLRFRDYAKTWADAQDWKASTRERSWPKTLQRLDPELGGLRLVDIEVETLETVRGNLAKKYARSTVEGDMHRAKAVLRYAYKNRKIGHNPTVGVKAAPKRRADDTSGKVTSAQVPTRAEALAILTAAPEQYRAAVALGLAGLRVGEVLGLTWDDIDLANRRVSVVRQTDGGTISTPKAEKLRTITVPNLVAVELRRHRRDYATDRWLFPGGGVEGTLHYARFHLIAWQPALKAAGLAGRFKFHSLRHFAASSMLSAGAPITAVAGHLGDTVETVSKVYAHWLRDDQDVPADVLDRVLAPSSGLTGASPAIGDSPVLGV